MTYCRDERLARLGDARISRLLYVVPSPVPGEGIYYHLSGGCAALTPGYYPITPTGFQNESLRDSTLCRAVRMHGSILLTRNGLNDGSRG